MTERCSEGIVKFGNVGIETIRETTSHKRYYLYSWQGDVSEEQHRVLTELITRASDPLEPTTDYPA